MPQELKTFFQRWLITTMAVLVAAHALDGIRYDSVSGLFAATLMLGLLNAFVRPLLMLLSLPLLVVSLGLFSIIINACLLYFVGQLRTFHVDTFWTAVKGAILISLISALLSLATGMDRARGRIRFRVSSRKGPDRGPGPGPGGPGNGPVIDV